MSSCVVALFALGILVEGGCAPPPPPLNPSQRAFAREHLAVQRLLASGRRRGEEPNITLEAMRQQGLRQVHLLVCVVADVADHCAQVQLRSSDSGGTEDALALTEEVL